jgi:hypothetical protein
MLCGPGGHDGGDVEVFWIGPKLLWIGWGGARAGLSDSGSVGPTAGAFVCRQGADAGTQAVRKAASAGRRNASRLGRRPRRQPNAPRVLAEQRGYSWQTAGGLAAREAGRPTSGAVGRSGTPFGGRRCRWSNAARFVERRAGVCRATKVGCLQRPPIAKRRGFPPPAPKDRLTPAYSADRAARSPAAAPPRETVIGFIAACADLYATARIRPRPRPS